MGLLARDPSGGCSRMSAGARRREARPGQAGRSRLGGGALLWLPPHRGPALCRAAGRASQPPADFPQREKSITSGWRRHCLCDVALEVAHGHFCHILQVTRGSPASSGRGLQGPWELGAVGHWGHWEGVLSGAAPPTDHRYLPAYTAEVLTLVLAVVPSVCVAETKCRPVSGLHWPRHRCSPGRGFHLLPSPWWGSCRLPEPQRC